MSANASQPLAFLGPRLQLGYVVKDMDAAMKYWTEVMKVGPFVLIESSRGNREIRYKGKPTDVDFKVAFAYQGDIQIELIQQINDAPSTYKDFIDSGKEGLHHVCFYPDDFQGACDRLEEYGFKDLYSVYSPDGERNVVYYEPPAVVGGIIEIVPMTPYRQSYFGRIRRLSDTWDGVTRPIRRFADRDVFLASGEGAE